MTNTARLLTEDYKLTETEYKLFYEQGFFVRKNLFSKHEVAEMSRLFLQIEAQASHFHEPTLCKNSYFVVNGSRIDRVVWACGFAPKLKSFGQDPRITKLCAELLGSQKLNQIICQGHFKLPNDNVAFEWHQDSQNRYYGTNQWKDINGKGSYVQTLIAIDNCPADSGPVCFIPGSLKQGHLALDVEANRKKYVRESEAIPLTMQKGDTVFFHPYVIHGSKPNNSDHSRRVFINGFAYPGANSFEYPGCGLGEEIIIES